MAHPFYPHHIINFQVVTSKSSSWQKFILILQTFNTANLRQNFMPQVHTVKWHIKEP